MSNILYQKLRQQYSLDGGATWNYVYNAYKVGNILENPSNCTSSDSKQYRWVELPISEGYTCDPTTYTKYTVEVEEVSNNGGLTWTRTGNQRQANVYEENSVDCGYSGSTSGDTSECGDRLSFEFSGTEMKYYLNKDPYTATTNPYSITLAELGIDTLTNCYGTFNSRNITKLTEFPCTTYVTDMTAMFYNCSALTSVDVSNFDTSNVTNMSSMFYYCRGLTSLDVSSFNTSNVTDMGGMFESCSGLTSLDLSNWDTSNVTDMSSMFEECSGLTSLDVSGWNTSAVTNMGWMFYGCSGLTSLDLSNWNASNVKYMAHMFDGCSGLTTLDLSSFDTSKVTNMDYMFHGCKSLTSLDLSNWDTSNVTYMTNMFDICKSLRTIKMCNCNQTTIDMITSALTEAGIQNQVTIIT